ncbi:MAG: 4Fe-4S dicluster domain-containing protein [Bacillota bacterium]
MTRARTGHSLKTNLDLNRSWCKGCGLCVTVCPKSILSLDERGKISAERQEECVGCGLCEEICPDFAIRVIKIA